MDELRIYRRGWAYHVEGDKDQTLSTVMLPPNSTIYIQPFFDTLEIRTGVGSVWIVNSRNNKNRIFVKNDSCGLLVRTPQGITFQPHCGAQQMEMMFNDAETQPRSTPETEATEHSLFIQRIREGLQVSGSSLPRSKGQP